MYTLYGYEMEEVNPHILYLLYARLLILKLER